MESVCMIIFGCTRFLIALDAERFDATEYVLHNIEDEINSSKVPATTYVLYIRITLQINNFLIYIWTQDVFEFVLFLLFFNLDC